VLENVLTAELRKPVNPVVMPSVICKAVFRVVRLLVLLLIVEGPGASDSPDSPILIDYRQIGGARGGAAEGGGAGGRWICVRVGGSAHYRCHLASHLLRRRGFRMALFNGIWRFALDVPALLVAEKHTAALAGKLARHAPGLCHDHRCNGKGTTDERGEGYHHIIIRLQAGPGAGLGSSKS